MELVPYDVAVAIDFHQARLHETVDVRAHCPGGAVAIREETTFWDGLCATLTLGIWSPRSSWYSCAGEGF